MIRPCLALPPRLVTLSPQRPRLCLGTLDLLFVQTSQACFCLKTFVLVSPLPASAWSGVAQPLFSREESFLSYHPVWHLCCQLEQSRSDVPLACVPLCVSSCPPPCCAPCAQWVWLIVLPWVEEESAVEGHRHNPVLCHCLISYFFSFFSPHKWHILV